MAADEVVVGGRRITLFGNQLARVLGVRERFHQRRDSVLLRLRVSIPSPLISSNCSVINSMSSLARRSALKRAKFSVIPTSTAILVHWLACEKEQKRKRGRTRGVWEIRLVGGAKRPVGKAHVRLNRRLSHLGMGDSLFISLSIRLR